MIFLEENETSENNESTADTAMVSDPKAAEQLAKTLEKKLAGWAYILPSITQSALTKSLDVFFIDEDA